ncbi:MAG: Phosphatidylinositol 4-kinase pik1alpha (PI4-kinase)(PtdIns-4-kinase) [Caeruleum heppii]|nr:MAG: Phosphatidylinositol 4-kinase pik1alpha (PI4-kinase)(PtdIns-4-kinase) [Caeruleum heppii]
MSWDLLKRFIESDHFNNDPFLSVAYLSIRLNKSSRYANHVGIHYVLCTKLRQFSYEEIEFFLPQLCHLVISIDNESMALEEFIVDLCEESVSGALLTFCFFQAYLHDLARNTQSEAFQTCRRIYNKVQQIVFGGLQSSRRGKIRDNVLPVTVLASFVSASIAAPFLPSYAGPLAVAQARRPRPDGITTADIQTLSKLGRSQTVATGSSRHRKEMTVKVERSSLDLPSPSSSHRPRSARTAPVVHSAVVHSPAANRSLSSTHRSSLLDVNQDARHSTLSLPDMHSPATRSAPPTPASAGLTARPSDTNRRRQSHNPRLPGPAALSYAQRQSLLKSNYFRSETQFLRALEDISNRLVIVPKAARLSALRAELALIAQDLPAEVDIPFICPAHLPDGSPARSQHHRVVRLNPAEATVLNSAERVPYLLMVELLREDFDFDPETDTNKQLVTRLDAEKSSDRRRIFDLTDSSRSRNGIKNPESGIDSVFEPAVGDLGNSALIQQVDDNDLTPRASAEPSYSASLFVSKSSSAATPATAKSSMSTPRSSGLSGSQGARSSSSNATSHLSAKEYAAVDPPDMSALATHMRTAAHMLAQLESSESKRPKDEVTAIKAKIIASMQTLEEQSFNYDERRELTFDSIVGKPDTNTAASTRLEELSKQDTPAAGSESNAGAARMENDEKTGGVERKGDRDDPSAAMFGEGWAVKKERIRRSSPYGWMKNWDLLSVIVKTGTDLRQEAFACQLIQVCGRIWQDAGVPVWVKRMRILVTGESSGLIETITNGVSLHSIKRSLTLAMIAAGTNPRGRIATLKDHFIKSFGEPETETYKAAVEAFTRSLAAYSIICYVLQLKDRHNGNILIDEHGHIIHIDFGFMLSNTPGSVGFEAAPFKLTQDYIDVLGGLESTEFKEFVSLCKQAFQALRKSADSLLPLISIMGASSTLPCFTAAGNVDTVVSSLRARFVLQLSEQAAGEYVEREVVGRSVGSYFTRLYDTFQYRTQGIY